MRCSQCQQVSPAGVKFCGECGARLDAPCQACGTVNPASNKFCGACGLPLGESGAKPVPPQAYTPPHLATKIRTFKSTLEDERKQVTVMFADLKGSMELLADRDPEEAGKLLDPVLERMMDAVHRYEGTVNQVMGDGIMALFGAPIAHEDHAVRAGYAALKMQEAIRAYAVELKHRYDVNVEIRIGMNSGEVVVRGIGSDLRMDYSAVGQTTHLAARMEQLAAPGTILVTEAFARLTEGYLHFKPLGLAQVKGLTEALDVLQLVDAEPTHGRFQAAARGLTRFVGRQAELGDLARAVERARAGHGQAVAVIGEPGVGKSRLFYEFVDSPWAQGWLVLETGSVSFEKARAYQPLRELLKQYFQIQDRDDAAEIHAKVAARLAPLDPALQSAVPALLTLLDSPVDDPAWQALDPVNRRHAMLDGAKRLLLGQSRAQPLLLIFENLHWIDPETQAFLDGLIDSLPMARIILFVNYRPEYRHAWGSKTFYNQLRLDPLPAESADELLDVLLGTAAELRPLKRLLVERTEGNPFFLEESVRTLVETKMLLGQRGARRLGGPLSNIQVPATVQSILAARIDRLPAEDKHLLQCAAVIGKDVSFSLLRAITALPEGELGQSLSELRAAEFLYETSLFPELEYTFKHALTLEVAYGSLLQQRRRVLHASIVEAIEAMEAERLSRHLERLAYHASRGEVWDKALRYARQAGAKAMERSAYAEAVSWLEQGSPRSSICRARPTSSGRRSISGSTSATRSCRSANTAGSWIGSEKRIDSPRHWGTDAAWAGCRPTWRASSCCWVNRSGRFRRRSAPSRWPPSTATSPFRSWRRQCSARLTMPRVRTRGAPRPCAETSPPLKAAMGASAWGSPAFPRSSRAPSSSSVSPRWGSSRRPRSGLPRPCAWRRPSIISTAWLMRSSAWGICACAREISIGPSPCWSVDCACVMTRGYGSPSRERHRRSATPMRCRDGWPKACRYSGAPSTRLSRCRSATATPCG